MMTGDKIQIMNAITEYEESKMIWTHEHNGTSHTS